MITAIGKRRVDVLSTLKASATPMTTAQIAARLEVHTNTVRFHLEHLEENGQVERVEPHHRGPGRPPQLYRAVRRMDPAGPTDYRLLAEILASGLAAEDDPAAKAREMGRAWGRTMSPRTADSPTRLSMPWCNCSTTSASLLSRRRMTEFCCATALFPNWLKLAHLLCARSIWA